MSQKKITVAFRDGSVIEMTTEDEDRFWEEAPFTVDDVMWTRVVEEDQ